MDSNIKVVQKIGREAGPSAVVIAGVHGNEVCGVRAFEELLPELEIDKGEVTFIIANLEAGRQGKRFVEKNLNRCFLKEQPLDLMSSLEGRTAKEIMPFLEGTDFLLDLHSSKSSDSLKYFVCEEDCLDLIEGIDAKNVLMGIDRVCPGGTDGFMFNLGKKGVCIECGLHEENESFEMAKRAILNFLINTGNLNGEVDCKCERSLFNVKYLYWCKNERFRLARDFKDFEKVGERTLIGFDGEVEVYVEAGDVVMFADETDEVGGECFLVVEEKILKAIEPYESGVKDEQ